MSAAIVRIPAPAGYARTAVDQALGTVPLVVLLIPAQGTKASSDNGESRRG
jgi:hypothetical protein